MKTKIFYGNQYVGKFNCNGERYTRLQRFGKFIKKTLIITAIIGVVSGLWYGTFKLGGRLNPVVTYAEKIVDTSGIMFNDKIDALKNEVADKLMACESGGTKDGDALIVFDTNKVASIGKFQFQAKTVQYYYKQLYQTDITAKEAVLIALDTEKARDLAIDVMFTTKNMASKDWYNCEKRHNLDAQIKIINQLAK